MTWNLLEQDPLQQTYDAIVVGSGATGGWAAKQLSEAGPESRAARSGRAVSPTEFTEHTPALQAEISRPLAGNRAHAARAEAVLRLHGIQLRVVRQRPGKSLQHAGRTSHSPGSACACSADARWSGAARATG